MKVTLKGRIIAFGEEKHVNSETATNVYGSVVIEIGSDQYPNPVSVSLSNGKLHDAMRCGIGQIIEVDAYIKGREYNGKYYTDIKGAEVRGQAPVGPPSVPGAPPAPQSFVAGMFRIVNGHGQLFTDEHGWIQDSPEWRTYLQSKGVEIVQI